MADSWWVVIPSTDVGKNAAYLRQVDLRVSYPAGSAGDKAMKSRAKYNDPNFGMWVTYWKGPFATEADAQAAQAPTGSPENPATAAVSAAENAAGGVTSITGLTDIADFFHRLTEQQTWVRVGEVGIGALILYVAIKGIGSGTAAGSAARSATKPVKKAAKVGVAAVTKKPPPPPRVTYRHSTITHVKAPAPVSAPKPKPQPSLRSQQVAAHNAYVKSRLPKP